MSGPTYVTDIPRVSSPDVCPPGKSEYGMGDLQTLFQDGFANDSIAASAETNRIPMEQLKSVADAKIKRKNESKTFTMPDGTTTVSQLYLIMDKQVMDDSELFKKLHQEYCHYEQRYSYALKVFLDRATSRNPTDNVEANRMLDVTITLNRRLNFMIEFMNYLAIERSTMTNSNVSSINSLNTAILGQQDRLKIVYNKIKTMNAVTDTQKEMIRYTKEKNNNVTNQVSLWAALNVLAIATIFYVYRS